MRGPHENSTNTQTHSEHTGQNDNKQHTFNSKWEANRTRKVCGIGCVLAVVSLCFMCSLIVPSFHLLPFSRSTVKCGLYWKCVFHIFNSRSLRFPSSLHLLPLCRLRVWIMCTAVATVLRLAFHQDNIVALVMCIVLLWVEGIFMPFNRTPASVCD